MSNFITFLIILALAGLVVFLALDLSKSIISLVKKKKNQNNSDIKVVSVDECKNESEKNEHCE